MKVSGFTFIRNGQSLGFPFIQSILSALPIVDEFIINVGNCKDDTLAMIEALNEPKIKIIQTQWNDHMRAKGYVYGQQKMIAQYSCTGEWALYIEGDELLHEKDYDSIRAAMRQHLDNPNVEALVFDYYHFYGNLDTYAWTPSFYRQAARLIKTSVRSFAPDGLYWAVLDKDNRKGRYPKAARANAHMYHYGWIRPEDAMIKKLSDVEHFWDKENQADGFTYANIDPKALRAFTGTHPAVLNDFYQLTGEVYQANPNYKLTKRDWKNRLRLKLESIFHIDTSKKHFSLVKEV